MAAAWRIGFRLPARILAGVRAACGPEFALLVKVDSNGCGDLRALLRLCQRAGVDGIEISGLDFATRAGEKKPFFSMRSWRPREGVEVPLIPVGGVFSRKTAEQVLEAGFPFVSFSRSLICQPDFISHMKENPEAESRCFAVMGVIKFIASCPVRCVQHTQPLKQLEIVFGPYHQKD